METKHTKGKWHLNKYSHIVDDNEKGVPITSATIPMTETEESIANAKLIAAAPDLLDACQSALEYMDDDGYEPIRTDLLKAIKKATL